MIESSFTPEVYWHYIGSQYFPSEFTEFAKDPEKKFVNVQEHLKEFCQSSLTSLEFDGYGKEQLLKTHPDLLNMQESSIKELRKDIQQDSIIKDLENQLANCTKTNKQIKENITNRLKYLIANLSNKPSLNFRLEAFEDIYTKEAFESFEKLHQGNEILSNIMHPDTTEAPYLESLQQQMEEEENVIDLESKGKKTCASKSGDDIVCEVCNDGDYEDKNMIVVCSTCDLSVHQKCYGIIQVPYDDWICDACVAFGATKRKQLKCALCSVKGGAMKPTTTSIHDSFLSKSKNQQQETPSETQSLKDEPKPSVFWVHLSCAHWMPELELWSKNYTKSISGLGLIDKKRFKLTCSICKQRGIGCCIQCNKGKCPVSFHVECARISGVYLEFEAHNEEASIAFCDKHKPIRLKKELEKSRKRTAEDILRFCKTVDKALAALSSTEKNHCDEYKGSTRKHRMGNKLFNKIEKKRLIQRIRFISQKYGQLFMTLAQQANSEYKISPKTVRLEYTDTLSKRIFPWNEVKIDPKFTPLNCYNKYISLIPDEETYKLKILGMSKERVEREKRLKLKMIKEEQKKNAMDTNKYCYCKKTVQEVASSMIGILFTHSRMLRWK